MNFSDTLTKQLVLEQAVVNILSSACKSSEPICKDYLLFSNNKKEARNKREAKLVIDYYLPEGCENLNIKKDTLIEVKATLTYDILNKLRRVSDSSGKEILLITGKEFSDLNRSDISIAPRLEVWSFQKLTRRFIRYYLSDVNNVQNIDEEAVKNLFNWVEGALELQELSGFEGKLKDDSRSTQVVDAETLANNAFRNGNITLFLGAGVSIDAGLPTWDSLLKDLLPDASQSPLQKEDYPAVCVAAFNSSIITARYLLAKLKSQSKSLEASDKLRDALYKNYKDDTKSELIKAIVEVCARKDDEGSRFVSSIITFNYDVLVEEALEKAGIKYKSISDEGKYERGSLPVIHVHGILKRKETNPLPILSEEAYHDLYKSMHSWSNVEILHSLFRNTCIFIGLSMSDPNLRRLLESVKRKSEGNYYHYGILPYSSLSHHNWNAVTPTKFYEKEEEKESYFKKLQEEVYEELGVKVIWYPEGKFDEIPKILRRIADTSR